MLWRRKSDCRVVAKAQIKKCVYCTHVNAEMNDHIAHEYMGWLRLVESIKSQVSFAKKPYKGDNILPKRPIILPILLTAANPHKIREREQICVHIAFKDEFRYVTFVFQIRRCVQLCTHGILILMFQCAWCFCFHICSVCSCIHIYFVMRE